MTRSRAHNNAMNSYWLFNGLAWVAASALWMRRGRRFAMPWGALVDGVVFSFPAAMVAAHVWTVAVTEIMRANWRHSLLTISGWTWGYTSIGAVAGVALTLVLVARLHRLPLGLVLDVAGPTVFVASILGRVACFLNGCCFGSPCSLPWAVSFTTGAGSMESAVARHPVPVYEILLSGTFLVLLPVWQKRWRLVVGSGSVFFVCIAMYMGTRLTLETLRAGHSSPVLAAGLTYTQWVCAPALTICLLLLWAGHRRRPLGRGHGPGSATLKDIRTPGTHT